jgi:hypothetical protein
MIVSESRTALGQSDVFGVAPFDVDQDGGRDVGLAFLPPHVEISSLPLRQIRELIDTISHESGHTFGLSHSLQSDSQFRQLVSTAQQNPGLDSRFSFEALPSEDLGVYSEANQLGFNVGFNPAQPNDQLTNQTLPNDTIGIVARPDLFVGTSQTIDFFGDRDAFRFVVPSTGSFTVRMIGDPGTGIDPVISLFSENGEALGSSGPGGAFVFDAFAGTQLYVVAGTSFDGFTGVPDNGAVGGYSLEMGPSAFANDTVFEAELTGGDPTFNVGPDNPGGFGGDDVPGIGGGTDLATLQVINQLVIENLQRVFAQPIPPGSGILAASITGISDVNGDGFADVSAVVVLQGARGRLMVFRLVFDGISPGGDLIGQPQVSIM